MIERKTPIAVGQVDGWQKRIFGHSDEWWQTEARKAWQAGIVKRPETFADQYLRDK